MTGGGQRFRIGKPEEDSIKERNKSKKKYIKKIKAELCAALDDPPSISSNWNKLDL